ncbi:MAG: TetR family transcriptional regulator [Streptosporangiales bacterium]|nr:TetR family transcriptional regulator [Streptosporangiales bacterium]
MREEPASNTLSGGRESKSARTRQRILDAAAFVLSRKGYAGTRLSDVAGVAGVQAPAVYYYFSSREALIEEVMRVGTRRTHDHVAATIAKLPADTTPMDRICAAVEAHLRIVLEISDYATASIRNAGQLPDEIRAGGLAERNSYADLWRHLIAEARASGELRPDIDPRAARMLILGALNWAPEWWNPRQGSLDNVVYTALAIVREGLTGQAPVGSPSSIRARLPAATGVRAGRPLSRTTAASDT